MKKSQQGQIFSILAVLTLFIGVLIPFAGVSADVDETQVAEDWCGTHQQWLKNNESQKSDPNACSISGPCDVAATRDGWIPSAQDPITWLRAHVHVFANDDGSNPASTPAMVETQMATLNEDLLPLRIQFQYDWRYVYSTQYRNVSDNELFDMKQAYAVSPESHINIFVAYVTGGYSYGTFPWDQNATTSQGGIVMTTPHWTGTNSTISHEMGHCLGLWHTHHGVSEVSQCSSCWERADGFEGDETGDFCYDTRPTPTHNNCSEMGCPHPCSATPLAPPDLH